LRDELGDLLDHREKWAFCFRNKKIMSLPGDFAQLLETYKDNYAAYRVTGNMSQKAIADSALAAIKKTIKNGQKMLDDNTQQIEEFLDKYSKENPRIEELHKKSQTIQKIGPALEDEYNVSKRLNAAPQVQPLSETTLYIKGAVVVGLLIIVGIVGAL
jgi:predicted ribosome quality control (RQC) complex YloA/Tae2 family protein